MADMQKNTQIFGQGEQVYWADKKGSILNGTVMRVERKPGQNDELTVLRELREGPNSNGRRHTVKTRLDMGQCWESERKAEAVQKKYEGELRQEYGGQIKDWNSLVSFMFENVINNDNDGFEKEVAKRTALDKQKEFVQADLTKEQQDDFTAAVESLDDLDAGRSI